MPTLTPFLTYTGKAEEAAKFYTSFLPDSRITDTARSPGDGSVLTVSVELMGRPFVLLNGGASFAKFAESFSLAITCDTQAELDFFWTKLLEDGGTPVACGWIADKYGVSWQVTPATLPKMLGDPQTGGKVFEAMRKMIKLDFAELKAAAAGQ
ncbi:3-demethylubiquinone-9 3-methyltransferase [Hyaloraphidium curvatum]|nr:3-demethylubiquinone-9 3-methyltransferase [Hyaloraphidium curvatum]